MKNINSIMIYEDKKKIEFNVFYKSTKIAHCIKHFYNPVTLEKMINPFFELYHDYNDRLATNFPDNIKFNSSILLYSIDDLNDFLVDLTKENV